MTQQQIVDLYNKITNRKVTTDYFYAFGEINYGTKLTLQALDIASIRLERLGKELTEEAAVTIITCTESITSGIDGYENAKNQTKGAWD